MAVFSILSAFAHGSAAVASLEGQRCMGTPPTNFQLVDSSLIFLVVDLHREQEKYAPR